jgi:hypothetical protein
VAHSPAHSWTAASRKPPESSTLFNVPIARPWGHSSMGAGFTKLTVTASGRPRRPRRRRAAAVLAAAVWVLVAIAIAMLVRGRAVTESQEYVLCGDCLWN